MVPLRIPAARASAPPGDAFSLPVECVAGVRLELAIPQGPLASVDCDPYLRLVWLTGQRLVTVSVDTLRRLGLQSGQTTSLTVRSTGRDTGQWRVYPPS